MNAVNGLVYLCTGEGKSGAGCTLRTAPMVYTVGTPAILPLVTTGCAGGCFGLTVVDVLIIVVLLLPPMGYSFSIQLYLHAQTARVRYRFWNHDLVFVELVLVSTSGAAHSSGSFQPSALILAAEQVYRCVHCF